jgi:hypothetical protein
MDKKEEIRQERITILPPKHEYITIPIVGNVPYVQLRFGEKAKQQMISTQEAGSTAKSKKKREPKDFEANYQDAMYRCDGWFGLPASAFRCAAVSACRLVGFKMTLAKLSIFIEPDGFDSVDETPLVKITKGNPEKWIAPVRNADGSIDLRARALWKPGWEAKVRVRFDGDQFTKQDVVNLWNRIGSQVGIGEGRPDSKRSCGINLGLFDIVDSPKIKEEK